MPSTISSSIPEFSSEGGAGTQNPVLLSLGGNLGGVEARFERALRRLSASGFRVLSVSSPFRNPADGCEPGAPDFTNLAVLGEWKGTPEELLKLVKSIEVAEGRPENHPHWHSRTLDIDLILMGSLRKNTPELTIPHPRARERDFVLIPAKEIAPESLLRILFDPEE